MAVTVIDDFDAPLGMDDGRRSRTGTLVRKLLSSCIAVLACALAAFGLWLFFADYPLGGEPFATASIVVEPPPAVARATVGVPSSAAQAEALSSSADLSTGSIQPASPAPGTTTVTVIDGMTGRREQVTIPANAEAESDQAPQAGHAQQDATARPPVALERIARRRSGRPAQ